MVTGVLTATGLLTGRGWLMGTGREAAAPATLSSTGTGPWGLVLQALNAKKVHAHSTAKP